MDVKEKREIYGVFIGVNVWERVNSVRDRKVQGRVIMSV